MIEINQLQYLIELQENYPNSADLINFLQYGKTKHFSFWTLINKYRIEIPIIQRDYAQGRVDGKSSQIRGGFVESLRLALRDKKQLHLDFIYGSSKGDAPLVLLDGQQRLTTLFLLHWYILHKLGKLNGYKELLQRFSYKTRISSKEFCQAIINKPIQSGSEAGISFADGIKSQAWFFRSWEKDPTIKGMLVMLEAIDKAMGAVEEAELGKMWHSLTQDEIIDFQFLNLEDFELTDELYIKMNARGKTLTNFENFKAWLIKKNGLSEEWSSKLDQEWTDLFWKHKAPGDYEIDTEYMQYFRGMSQFKYALTLGNGDLLESCKDNLLELIDSVYIPYSLYEELALFSPNCVADYFSVLNKLEGKNIEVLKVVLGTTEQSIFKKFIDSPTYWDRTVFFALCCFLWQVNEEPFNFNEAQKENLRKWMRVWRNLIQNTTIDDPAAFVKAIKEIDRVKGSYGSIYEDLDSKLQINFFSENQRSEEKLKASLILENPEWEDEIISYEQHPYFYGQIGFLLDYAFVGGQYDLGLFKKYAEKASILFSEHLNTDEFDLERALLTKGNEHENYLIRKGNNLCFCLSSAGTLRQREENWRRVFRDTRTNGGKQCLLELLEDNRSLEEICQDAVKIADWRRYLIEQPKLMAYCKQRLIRKENNSFVRLLGSSKLSHYHAELFTYYIFCLLKGEGGFNGFNYKYEFVRGGGEFAHIAINDWVHKQTSYSLHLYYIENRDDVLPNPFRIRFFNSKGNNGDNLYCDLTQDLLSGFVYQDGKDHYGYWFLVGTVDEAQTMLVSLLEKLRSISG